MISARRAPKLKISKREPLYYDPETSLVTNRHWILRLTDWIETNDPDLELARKTCRRMVREPGMSTKYGDDARIPPLGEILGRVTPEYVGARKTGWGKRYNARTDAGGPKFTESWAVELGAGEKRAYVDEGYMSLVETAYPQPEYRLLSPTHMVAVVSGGEILGGIMPLAIPER